MASYTRRDPNHHEIAGAYKRSGRPFSDVSGIHGFGCDLVAEHIDGYPVFVEVKKPGPPSCRKLTDSEKRLQALFPRFYFIAQNIEEAFQAVGLLPPADLCDGGGEAIVGSPAGTGSQGQGRRR
jgi:hypothetical protein